MGIGIGSSYSARSYRPGFSREFRMLKEIIILKTEVSVSEIVFMKCDIYLISAMLSDKNDATGYDNCIQSWVQSRKGKS